MEAAANDANRPEADKTRLRSIDALRGLAALAVLLTHVPHLEWQASGTNRLLFLPLDFGARGVPLFLVISGFCIHLSVARRMVRGEGISCRWGAFWKRRFYRLYPPYLAAAAFSLLLLLPLYQSNPSVHRYLDDRTHLAWDLGTHLLLVHNLFPAYNLGLGNAAFWTLGLEEQLYALYAVFLLLRCWLPLRRAFLTTAGVTGVWCALGVVGTMLGIPWSGVGPEAGWPSWPLAWWPVWTLGAVAAEAYAGHLTLPRWAYHRLVAVGGVLVGVLAYWPVLDLFHVDAFVRAVLGGDHPLGKIWCDRRALTRVGELAFAVACFIVVNRLGARRGAGPVPRTANGLAEPGGNLFVFALPDTQPGAAVGGSAAGRVRSVGPAVQPDDDAGPLRDLRPGLPGRSVRVLPRGGKPVPACWAGADRRRTGESRFETSRLKAGPP
jgi:peptidoglycan/LPS O-acetylase OafA/YrhL